MDAFGNEYHLRMLAESVSDSSSSGKLDTSGKLDKSYR